MNAPALSQNAADTSQPAKHSNGLKSFALHTDEAAAPAAMAFAAAAAAPSLAPELPSLSHMSATAAAQYYLQQALGSAEVPQIAAVEVNGATSEFKSLSSEIEPLTNTHMVKFRQYYRKVPVYGSLVTVELDESNNLLCLNTSLGDPVNVDHLARVSPTQVVEKVRVAAGYTTQPLDVVPRLIYYYDSAATRWRLAYLVEDVLKRLPETDKSGHGLPQLVDFVVDAHKGDIVVELPRTQTIEDVEEMEILDELQRPRRFFTVQDGSTKTLYDRSLNVQTYDFNFQDVELNKQALPGISIPNPPNPWSPGAVSAHANAVEVARFLREVLQRNGLDNRGEALVSSVNCRYHRHGTDSTNKEWRNAAWIGKQMVYGQKQVGGQLRSYAAALDVVAHEICHGLTDRTSRLQYQAMTGALNESYSDIFGVIISNFDNPDIATWNWQMGEELEESGIPIRDFANPARHNQPEHMDHYRITTQDYGGVHINSGIHNKAAYNLLVSKLDDTYAFSARTAIQIFYLALTQHLSRTSGFSDSRRGVLLAARSLLRADGLLTDKLQLIEQAFRSVGIQ